MSRYAVDSPDIIKEIGNLPNLGIIHDQLLVGMQRTPILLRGEGKKMSISISNSALILAATAGNGT